MQKDHEIGTEQSRNTKPPQSTEAQLLRDLDELISSAQGGDKEALNQLLAHARPRLYAVALRMVRDRDDAEDVVQESLLKVCRHLTRFERRSAFSTWLHRIVVNTGLDRLRRQQSRCERTTDVGAGASEGHNDVDSVNEETPERLYERAEAGAVVHEAMSNMSPAHRQALILREMDGESYQAIAEIAHCPVGTIMSRLHHARRRLAEELAPFIEETISQAA